jgi:predicted outer membrane protein
MQAEGGPGAGVPAGRPPEKAGDVMMTNGAFDTARRMAVLTAALAVLPAAANTQTRENNRAVHAFISAVDLGEVQQSMLAQERASSPEVRRYALMMITDHGSALHGREARLGQENQGLLGQDDPDEQAGAAAQGPLPPAYGAGNGGNVSGTSVPPGQKLTSTARGSDGAGVGKLPPAYGPGNGSVETQTTQTGTTTTGGENMAEAQQTREGRAVEYGSMPGLATLSPELMMALERALREHPVSRPVVIVNARNLAVLQGVNAGPQFDATYMDAQIAGHRYTLTNLDRMIAGGGVNDEVMGIMRATRATIATHLEQAQAIRSRLQ